ncbi:hypothetical protein [Burkholderia gladioli]|uniref:hypothetical protein n=1 Tax=Burkholderia gladioli TaxID=28095 RepID=UPI001641B05F|nr:hypothetical protein [Burkholderia gladioli]
MNAPVPLALLSQAEDASVTGPIVDVAAIVAGNIKLPRAQLDTLEITDILDAEACLDQTVTNADATVDAAVAAGRAVVPMTYDLTRERLATLQHFVGQAQLDFTTTEGLKAAKGLHASLTTLKTAAEDDYKRWNEPILAMGRKAREQRDAIVSAIDAMRAPIKNQIDAAVEARKAKERETQEAEARRIDGHTAAITKLERLHEGFVSASSSSIAEKISELTSFEYLASRDWEEYGDRARDAVRTNIEALKLHLVNAEAREKLAELQARQEAAEAERLRNEEAAAAERNRVAALRERIQNIQNSPTVCIGMKADQIQRTLDRVNKVDVTEFAELQAEAEQAVAGARNNLETMLQGAKDAEELAELRHAKKEREEAEAKRVEDEAREAREAAERAAREAAEAAAASERAAREAREASERAEREAAEAARKRTEALAETLLNLLSEAREHVPAGDLADRIDAALVAVKGE